MKDKMESVQDEEITQIICLIKLRNQGSILIYQKAHINMNIFNKFI